MQNSSYWPYVSNRAGSFSKAKRTMYRHAHKLRHKIEQKLVSCERNTKEHVTRSRERPVTTILQNVMMYMCFRGRTWSSHSSWIGVLAVPKFTPILFGDPNAPIDARGTCWHMLYPVHSQHTYIYACFTSTMCSCMIELDVHDVYNVHRAWCSTVFFHNLMTSIWSVKYMYFIHVLHTNAKQFIYIRNSQRLIHTSWNVFQIFWCVWSNLGFWRNILLCIRVYMKYELSKRLLNGHVC